MPVPVTVSFSGLFLNASSWIKHVSTDIDSQPASDATLNNTSSGSAAFTVTTLPGSPGAAEFGLILAPPQVGADLVYWTYGFRYKISSASLDLLVNGGRHENDVKFCFTAAPNPGTKIQNIANGSVQRNYSNGGEWDIDDGAGGWAPTGIVPSLPRADTWNTVEHRFSIDAKGLSMTVVSLSENGILFPVNKTFAFNLSNWGQAVAPQIQAKTGAPGGIQIEYDAGYLIGSGQPLF